MAKAAANRQKKDLPEEKQKHLAKEVRRLKMESYSSGIRRDAGLRKRGKEYGAGRNGREVFRTERGSVPQKPLFRCDNQCSEKDPQLLAAGVGGAQ